MGQYHYCVNLTKKQFIHPHRIGNGLKLHEQIGWEYSTSTALVMLLAACAGRGGGDFNKTDLVGSWAGDSIAFIGDYAESQDIPNCDAKEIFAKCSTSGEYTDISEKVREMMSSEFKIDYSGNGWMEIKQREK